MRIFNTYGPRMHPEDGREVSNFIVQALKNIALIIYRDGSQTRSFCYVDDLISGMHKLMNSAKGITGPVNIGNPSEFTIRQLAQMVIHKTGSSSLITYLLLPQDDPLQRKPVIDMAEESLGWEPSIGLNEGLDHTVSYFKKTLV